MLWSDAEAAIRAYVETAWALTAYAMIPLVWENEIAPPQSTFVVMTIEGVFAEKTIFGTTGKRESIEHGLVFYHCFVPTGTGKQAALLPVVTMTGILQLTPIAAGLNFAGANPPSPVERGEAADASITAAQPAGVYYRCSGSVPFILITAV
jgi:hypothetical protein